MVRSLLVERFGMNMHSGTQDFPIYNLVVDENGAKLKAASPEAQSRT